MTAPTKLRFVNISAFTYTPTTGSALTVNTIEEVSTDLQVQELADSGDDDGSDTWVAAGKLTARFELKIKDVTQADALRAETGGGVVTFTSHDPVNAKTLTVTINGAVFFNRKAAHTHNKVSVGSVTGRCFSLTGVNPITVVAA